MNKTGRWIFDGYAWHHDNSRGQANGWIVRRKFFGKYRGCIWSAKVNEK